MTNVEEKGAAGARILNRRFLTQMVRVNLISNVVKTNYNAITQILPFEDEYSSSFVSLLLKMLFSTHGSHQN